MMFACRIKLHIQLQEGGIDRQALSKLVVGPSNAENLKKLEAPAKR